MESHKKCYITVGNERIEVTEEVYRTYWHYTVKERYFGASSSRVPRVSL